MNDVLTFSRKFLIEHCSYEYITLAIYAQGIDSASPNFCEALDIYLCVALCPKANNFRWEKKKRISSSEIFWGHHMCEAIESGPRPWKNVPFRLPLTPALVINKGIFFQEDLREEYKQRSPFIEDCWRQLPLFSVPLSSRGTWRICSLSPSVMVSC